MLDIISLLNSCCNFNLDFLCLAASFASSGVGSGVGLRAGIASKFFIGNNMLLNLLRTLSLELNNNPRLLKKLFF